MSRVIDLTEKLGLADKPKVRIGDVELVVNDSAASMLQIMKLVEGDGTSDPEAVFKACDLLFDKPSHKVLDAMELSFSDFAVVMEAAIDLAAGGVGGEPGNGETPATT